MSRKIQSRRGFKDDLPDLNEAEFGFTKDTLEVYIGSDAGNIKIPTEQETQSIADVAEQNAKDYADEILGSGGGGETGGPISANNVVETSSKQFVTASQKAQIESSSAELANHSLRINNLETLPAPSATDELVKINAEDSAGYLADKVDDVTIKVVGGKLATVGIDGLTATITEINHLNGVSGNVQAQINALSSIGNFTTSVDNYAELGDIADPAPQDMVIVLEDETKNGAPSIYIYNGTDWAFAGDFKGGEVRDFTTNPLNLTTESTGILQKSKYEKQNASETLITDSANNFIASDVEGALAELFTYANDIITTVANAVGSPLNASDSTSQLASKLLTIKTDLASAITDKGVPAYPYNSIAEMIDKIKVIPNVGISGALKQTSKINVTAPFTHQIVLSEPLSVEDIAVSVLRYVGNESGVVHYQAEYNNGESSSFIYDQDSVLFDGHMRIRDEWDYPLTKIVGDYRESEEIDFTKFSAFDALIFDDDFVKIKGLKSSQAIVKADGDISLIGVETLDAITLNNVVSGAGIAKMALSFDKGFSWGAWDGAEWRAVDVDDKADIKNNGMSASVINLLSDSELSLARGDSDSIRFAYYLERPTINDVANNDKIQLSVSMRGYNEIANTAEYSYSYDPAIKTLTITFNGNGTYQINYVDGE